MQRAEEVATKLDAVRGWLDHNDLDAALITTHSGFAWVTAGGDNAVAITTEAGVASVLVTGEDAYLLAPSNDLRQLVDEQVAGAGLTPVEWPWHEHDGEGPIVEHLCDPARTVSDLGRLGLPVAPPDLSALRFTLLAPEIGRQRALASDATDALEVAALAARPGDREADVAARLAYECGRRGVTAVVILVAADDRITAYGHPRPTDRRLERALLVSLTARRQGLHASLTRMVGYGRPDPAVVASHAAAVRIDARLIAECHPGAPLGEVFAAGVDQYEREGHGTEWRLHDQGGLTGYAVREVVATATCREPLREGRAVAWNPTVRGARSEDTVLVGTDGPEVLTRSRWWPQERVMLDGGPAAAGPGTAVGGVDRPALLLA